MAQSESRLAAGRSQVSQAESNYTASRATYRQVIGVEPGKLAPATSVDRLSPANLPGAIGSGRAQNPSVTAAMFGIDVQALQVKINEGTLYPTLTATANVLQSWEVSPVIPNQFAASLIGQLNVPIYQGGANYAQIRSSKETLGQKRLDLETARDQVQANVVQAWGALTAAKAQIEATQAQVSAAEIALNGCARGGAGRPAHHAGRPQCAAGTGQCAGRPGDGAARPGVVASYSLLSAVGRLSPVVLGLPTSIYDPVTHYHQIRDSWGGVRTPDGR